ncbi:YtxH domain-containing protein [Mucilaginibacter sp. CAU 1740]|uniref:YtxH domain-containing protein n=1 Tax=Mucilaginibacter sp. CAU 1740 TaxID=3140365 RepID=UPI00325B3A2A
MSETKVVIAVLAGLVAGAAIGILLAPENGSETRNKLSESLLDLGESIKNAASEQINNLGDVFKNKIVNNIKEIFGNEIETEVPDDLEHA